MSLAYILFVRGNSGDLDDIIQNITSNMLFAVLRESVQLLYYRSTPKHDAVRELRYDGTVIKINILDRQVIAMF